MKRITTDLRARHLGKLHGKQVTRFPVIVRQEWLDRELHDSEVAVEVIAHTAADAADLVRNEVAAKVERPTQITVVGVKGGVAAHRFIGYDSMVWANFLEARPKVTQLELFR